MRITRIVKIEVSLYQIMAGIYIHIPFCKQACHYCDFHFSTNTSIRKELIAALQTEVILQREYLKGEHVGTLYFGGGTPSLLMQDELQMLMSSITSNFTIVQPAEITLEANPDDLTKEKLDTLKKINFNRLSIGIQSFNNNILHYLNRAHSGEVSIEAVENSRKAGFTNISLDLIYAIPGQTNEMLRNDLEKITFLNPDHVSAYSLTIEKKTAFGIWAKQGKLKEVQDDIAAAQLELIINYLEDKGYQQYEVSNFSKPGCESRHNTNYWKQQKYLGLGPSAHSYNGVSRQYNVSNNHLYVQSLNAGQVPCQSEVLTRENHVNEYLMTGLRTSWGVDLSKLKDQYGYDLISHQAQLLEQLQNQKLAIVTHEHVVLTKAGRFLADKISSDLFLIS